MEIYDEKMERIVDPDLTLGWLEDTVRRVEHEKVPAVQEIWHYETAAEYENGGRDVVKVVDVPGVPAREAWEENVPIQIYHPYTQAQLEEIEAEKKRPTQEQRLQRVEEAMSRMTAALAQLQTDVGAAMAWMMQKEA
ncbi:MAG: hypothetical protein SPD88_05460 [Candidatus Ventricola sp.]|nr:hypothetical protein [Candidatus Ventricola sp.]MDY4854916.1 hypothetical protein [Candidatus Ventricola sp.]